MDRRQFIVPGGALLLAGAWHARAQPKTWRIGFLGGATASGYAKRVDALRAGLRDLGYLEGKNLAIDYRWAEGRYERLPALAAELLSLKVDVLVTHGTPGALAAKRATKTVPVVLATAGDPVAAGIVTNLARPEANITGLAFFVVEVVQKRLELIKETLPRATRVAALLNPGNPSMPRMMEAMGGAARTLKLSLSVAEARSAGELESAISAIRADALLAYEDGILLANAGSIALLTNKARLPSIGFTELAEAGGLMSYSVDQLALYRRAAVFVDKILKGAKPGELPIERGSKFDMVINLKTARTLGLAIPASVLQRADRVIE